MKEEFLINDHEPINIFCGDPETKLVEAKIRYNYKNKHVEKSGALSETIELNRLLENFDADQIMSYLAEEINSLFRNLNEHNVSEGGFLAPSVSVHINLRGEAIGETGIYKKICPVSFSENYDFQKLEHLIENVKKRVVNRLKELGENSLRDQRLEARETNVEMKKLKSAVQGDNPIPGKEPLWKQQ